MPENPFAFLAAQPERRRRRGGLAGVWDRNKGVIQPIASGLAGALGGPAAGAAVGGLMRGLDRPGRGGVGLDVGNAAQGAVAGYGAGSLGEMARGGAARLLGRGATMRGPEAAAMERARTGRATTRLSGGREMVPSAAGSTPLDAGAGIGQEAAKSSESLNRFVGGGRLGRGLRAVGQFVKQNPEAVGAGLQVASGIIGSQAERRMQDERLREERRRAENLGLFAAPLWFEMQGGR